MQTEPWTGRQDPIKHILEPPITHDGYLHFREITRGLRKAAPLAHGVLLDVGAGRSPYRPIFGPRVERYMTLDFFKSKGTITHDIVAPATAIPLPKGSIDTVLCTQVLEHLTDPNAAVKEMHRVLKKGGWCIASTHMATVLHGEPYDYFRFTKYALKEVVFKDFSEVRVIENGGALLAMAQFWAWAVGQKLPKILSLPMIVFLNVTIPPLDRLFFSDVLTINYTIMARK